MGTNYYAIKKLEEADKKHMIKLINEDKVKELISYTPSPIHIGKSSAGWQFCFDPNGWHYFDASLDSICAFLKSCRIEDEYGHEISYGDFWIMVSNKKNGDFGSLEHHTKVNELRFANYTDFT